MNRGRRQRFLGWWSRARPPAGSLGPASVAAVPRAAAAVPDGMAAAALIGVNPLHGLFAAAIGPIVGGLTASTKLMVITTTSAAALAAASALQGVPVGQRLPSLFLMTLLAGGLMVAAGFFGFGWLTAFVSQSVMTGFLTGVALSILLRQFPDLTGVAVEATGSVGQAIEVLLRPGAIHLPTLLVGLSALALLVLLPGTRLGPYAALVALVVPSVVVASVGYFDGVFQVADAGEIVRGLPTPAWPQFRLISLDLLAGAVAVAGIVLVQGAGVADAYPNPDRTRSDRNGDFLAQGWANVASGLFRGIPVGGSVSQTALNVAVGGRDRWASVLSGVWVLVVLALLSGLAGQVAIPTLAAILVVASANAIRPASLLAVWQSGPEARIALATTFAATLLLPVAAAVGIGVALSLLLNLGREAQEVRVVALVERPDGTVEEQPAPATLPSRSVTVLNVYGSLFYAGARTFEGLLPRVGEARRPVVVIRIRGKSVVGATAFAVLSAYAEQLAEHDGRLYLSGVDQKLMTQFKQSGRIGSSGPIRLVGATPALGESTRQAMADANAFLLAAAADRSDDPPPVPLGRRLLAGVARVYRRNRSDRPPQ
jgi:sulfate permease, SulP family